ncbi:hypothetical protein [Clostridium sp. HMP27]|uniref:hypothetical protein n=1 Tax=Clostridium sp. HMP27 TaxID=1487921 RepID=UPI00052C97E5|nr:hypothetical protein [Clostridium sp. HMP27]KGK85780.1 hypothetical protein DP68_15935 [Clostridium sp. HMP27]
MHIKDLIEKYGSDLSHLTLEDFKDVDFTKTYRDILENHKYTITHLPNLPELFQVIKDKSLYLGYIPEGDYSNFNFQDVNLNGCTFNEKSILPSDYDLFQNIRYMSLEEVTLPQGDYSNYDFTDVSVSGTTFTPSSIIPRDFFSKVYKKSVKYALLPLADYTDYDFQGVDLNMAFFRQGSVLPEELKKLAVNLS